MLTFQAVMIIFNIHHDPKTIFNRKEKKCQNIYRKMPMLAWRLLCETCAKLIDFLRNIIANPTFIDSHRLSDHNFLRSRKLPFHSVIFFLINLSTGSYQKELDNFFKVINGWDIPKRFVTKVAWCKARMKLAYDTFIDLNDRIVDYFYGHFTPLKWNGFYLQIIDGTTVRLPNIKPIVDHFGAMHPVRGSICPMARVSQMYDPLNRISVDAIIAAKDQGERELASLHFFKLMEDDLVLLDRGYACFWLFELILSTKANLCVRMPLHWKCVKTFLKSGKAQESIWLSPAAISRTKCREMGLDMDPLPLRLIRIKLPSGETEVLITSLLDTSLYPHEIFRELYHQRWFVEEDIKTVKCWIEIENFTGKSVLSVYQDFHARILAKNLTSMLSFPTRETIEQRHQNCQYGYQINFAYALSAAKQSLALLFTRPVEMLNRLIQSIFDLFICTTEPIRPDRMFDRNSKRKKIFHMCYKAIG
jgi:hypothetical protein